MRPTNFYGVMVGTVLGITGLALLGTLSLNPCNSMALVFDNARESPLYNALVGFECEQWPTLMEGVLLEWAPAILVIALAGACGARIGEPIAPRRGAVTGALVTAIAFSVRTIFVSYGFFQEIRPFHIVLFSAVSIFIGLFAGWVGGSLAKRVTA